MATESFELRFPEWRVKACEKLTMILIKLNDCRELTEDDEALLKELFRIYYFGNYTIMANRLKGVDELAEQQGLFADSLSDFNSGTPIVNKVEKPNLLKK